MISAKLFPKGQITLPRRVRQALQVKPGDRVLFVVEDRTVLLRPVHQNTAKALAGSLHRYAAMGTTAGPVREAVKREVARAAAQEG